MIYLLLRPLEDEEAGLSALQPSLQKMIYLLLRLLEDEEPLRQLCQVHLP